MDHNTAVKIAKEYAPELIIEVDTDAPHINVRRTKGSLRCHSITLPSDMLGQTPIPEHQQREALIFGLDEARRILPKG